MLSPKNSGFSILLHCPNGFGFELMVLLTAELHSTLQIGGRAHAVGTHPDISDPMGGEVSALVVITIPAHLTARIQPHCHWNNPPCSCCSSSGRWDLPSHPSSGLFLTHMKSAQVQDCPGSLSSDRYSLLEAVSSL